MEGDALIRNVGRSRLYSEDDLNDTNLTNSVANNLHASVNDDRGESKGMFLMVLGTI